MEELLNIALIGRVKEIKNEDDAFFVFACLNFLNASLKNGAVETHDYKFKLDASNAINHILKNKIAGIDIFLDKEIAYVKVKNYQFSFHHLKYDEELIKYKESNANVPQPWSGIRLQPMAKEILEEALNANN